ncbi:MAG: hypothetical protein LBV18_06730 [Alistipes sp.]|jgi:hypothetical protein|nr:hypothetical protein [Alistipes sp.]
MKNITTAVMALGALATLSGCVTDPIEHRPSTEASGELVAVTIDFEARGAAQYATRAGYPDPFNAIDNINMFLFEDTDGEPGITDGDAVIERRYFAFEIRQEIDLRPGTTYHAYAIANLDDSNVPYGNLREYFDDVHTFGDLKRKYIVYTTLSPQDLGKLPLASGEVQTLTIPADPAPDATFTETLTLDRVYAHFSINLHNKVVGPGDPTVTSGVNPRTMYGVNFTRGSFLFPRDEDFNSAETGYTGGDYYRTAAIDIAPTGGEPIVEANGNYYTVQHWDVFTFENRKGSESQIVDYGDGADVEDVYGRYTLAPQDAAHIRITSFIGDDAPDPEMRGKTLLTWVHAGKGRSPENNRPDDVTNFDVDRNTVYHFNVYINGLDDVSIDTRREYLDQLVLFELPAVADAPISGENRFGSVDAHYVDLPGYISGTVEGFLKIQSGTGTLAGAMSDDWVAMEDDDADADKWLRFSMPDPTDPVNGAPVTWYTPEASTVLYADMPAGGGQWKKRLLLHFNENIDYTTGTGAVVADEGEMTVNPPFRTALVRIGFVQGAHSEQEYLTGVAEGRESFFFHRVDQNGLKTVGTYGGFEGGRYHSQLGIESVEENRIIYYENAALPADLLPADSPASLFWRFTAATTGGQYNQPYDGLAATRGIYDRYRDGGTPPQRAQTNLSPAGGLYNPFSNTNAADYCMRKNRDENGDGVISGDEVKWYLPTPAQTMQIYQWRSAFDYTINQGIYRPFGLGAAASVNYWTTNESTDDPSIANASQMTQEANFVVGVNKNELHSVRCVRDIPGMPTTDMFYYSEGHLVANLEGQIPNLDDRKPGQTENTIREAEYNTVGEAFLIGRWYRWSSGTTPQTPAQTIVGTGNGALCGDYGEPGFPTGWQAPSERELALIYANSGLLEAVMEETFGGPHDRTDAAANTATFHYFEPGNHWGVTNVGNNSTFWYIDFTTGISNMMGKQSSNYSRCIRHLTPGEIPPAPMVRRVSSVKKYGVSRSRTVL